MDLRLESYTSINLYTNKFVFNYVNTYIKGFFINIFQIVAVSTILLTLRINALLEYIGIWY